MQTTYMNTPVGWLMLCQEADAICRIHFMDDAPPDDFGLYGGLLGECVSELSAYFEGSLKEFKILRHCGQEGTVFQQRVWKELVNIPFGKTASYREMAIRLGDEKCIRAAASANGQNNLAIVVPCHRVIGSDGSLTGYAGGLWRKKWLLDHEAKFGGGVLQGSFGF